MLIPPTPLVAPLPLTALATHSRASLPDSFLPAGGRQALPVPGTQVFRGMPFDLGSAVEPSVLVLTPGEPPRSVPLAGQPARWVLILHLAANELEPVPAGLSGAGYTGSPMGEHLGDYTLVYADGTRQTQPIRRRFEIQQARLGWGPSAMVAMPANADQIMPSADEQQARGEVSALPWGRAECRHFTQRGQHLWFFALPVDEPERPLAALELAASGGPIAIFGLSLGRMHEHPLRPGLRQKLRLRLPPGLKPDANGEVRELGLDLGQIISARVALNYDESQWLSPAADVQPVPTSEAVLVEFSAHPEAILYLSDGQGALLAYPLAGSHAERFTPVAPARQRVRLRILDHASKRPLPARLHLHGEAGEYLPPLGHHRKVNAAWFEDVYGEWRNRHNDYAFVPGDCEADLPLGRVFVDLAHGHEYRPVRTVVTITAETKELVFPLERVLDWRARGWVSADTHVHFLSPSTALLEGQAEDLNVVNLLASQWGEMYSNVGDYDGRLTHGSQEAGGDGEFLVRVGSENRMQVLGHISLLGYGGRLIQPLCTGGPDEAAAGDPLEACLTLWAERCRQQGGLVVMPHAPQPQCERAATIVMGLVDAMEMMSFNPHTTGGINPYGIADWYRFQNLGYQIPLSGGSDKMSASSLVGGLRTYTHLGERPFSYEAWMAATRAGNTFVTIGPLLDFQVEGQAPGSIVDLPRGGGTVAITWRVASLRTPISQVELIQDGLVVADWPQTPGTLQAEGRQMLKLNQSSWVALRVRGSLRQQPDEIAAHSSAVQILVDQAEIFRAPEADTVLRQIEGAMAYLDTLAPREDQAKLRQLRAGMEVARRRLHLRLHRHGVFHHHAPTRHHPEHG